LFALCIESSHQRGMGHLFRMLRFALFLRQKGERVIFYLNHHAAAMTILQDAHFDYRIVKLEDITSNWEQGVIQCDGVAVWVNDRLNTCRQHAKHVKAANIKLVTLDDLGSGAELSDLNVAALVFDRLSELQGCKVLSGAKYLILDQKIGRFQRVRTEIKKVLVSMGGSDTYGVSLQVVQQLKQAPLAVTVIAGPGFEHIEHLQKLMPECFELRVNVPSLVEMFSEFDLVFTAGGVTPFEACATGLPCVVTATEEFEIPVGKELEKMGGCVFAGYYKNAKYSLAFDDMDIRKMSEQAMLSVDGKGSERVYREVIAL